MTTVTTSWGDWTITSIDTSTISDTDSATSAAIDNNGYTGTEIAVTIDYGSTANQGVDVYVLRDVDSNYESITDLPFSFQMPYNASSYQYRAFTVMSDRVSRFKIMLVNNTSASVVASVAYKQSQITAV